MRRSLWPVLAGLVLAIVAAAAVALVTGIPLAAPHEGESGLWNFTRTLLPIAAYALPASLAAIALSEARRVRGLAYFLFIGVIIAALGFIAMTGYASPVRSAVLSMPSFFRFMLMGLAAGYVYWSMAGTHAGRLAADFARASDGSLDETGARRRCRSCAALGLMLGLVPLALLGWYAFYRHVPDSVALLTGRAEADANQWLKTAGMPWVKLRVENYVGHITGSAPDVFTRTAAFDKAKSVLAPMVGQPGIVAYLQNDITAPDLLGSADMAAAEKRKAGEETARIKAVDDAKKSAEAGARKKAEIEANANMSAKAKRRAEEAARIATEAEADAKAKAEETARMAAEAKRKSDAAAAMAAKAEDEKRIAAEALSERTAVDAARKAAADDEARRKTAAAEPVKPAPPAVAPPPPAQSVQCAGAFSDLFRAETLRFALNSAELSKDSGAYLDTLAGLAKRCADFALMIDGHADRIGDDAINQAVSEDRADAVRDALLARGIAADHLVANGYGAERPFDPANTRAAYKLNRRVDFGVRRYAPPAAPVPPSAPPVALGPLAPGQCAPAFSRLFLGDAVRFEGSSAELTDDHASIIDRIASLALRCPSFTLYLDGHTDRRGSAAFNQRLSEARANAVRFALIDRDVAKGRIVAHGYGGQRPFDPGNTAEAFALNRRVDFGIAEKSSTKP